MTDSTDRATAYDARRAEFAALDDAALKVRFWELADQLVAPIVDLARAYTSPSIERSVLLRMGIDSVSCHGIVDRIAEAGLLGKGAGHVLVRLARREGTDVRTAAMAILADANCLHGLFLGTQPTAKGGDR